MPEVELFQNIVSRLKHEPMTRIVAFGSSNTELGEHSEGTHNWFDWLDVGLRGKYGRVHHMINAGVSGQTTKEMLDRFDRDVALYQPHVVIITAGGNDCSAKDQHRRIPLETYVDNLKTIVFEAEKLGATAILQTYYSIDLENVPPEDKVQDAKFADYMNAVVNLAGELNCHLLDNFSRWEPLRTGYPDKYRTLMRDNWHVNAKGNMLWGLDIMRNFGGMITDGRLTDICSGGFADLRMLDLLST